MCGACQTASVRNASTAVAAPPAFKERSGEEVSLSDTAHRPFCSTMTGAPRGTPGNSLCSRTTDDLAGAFRQDYIGVRRKPRARRALAERREREPDLERAAAA